MVATDSRPVVTGTRGRVKPKGNFGVTEVFFILTAVIKTKLCMPVPFKMVDFHICKLFPNTSEAKKKKKVIIWP